jgi:hypothetical protein
VARARVGTVTGKSRTVTGVRGGVGEPLPPSVAVVGAAATVVTCARCREPRRCGWRRVRPGETCGNLDPGRDMAGSRGTRTTGELRSAFAALGRGGSGPKAEQDDRAVRTADATVAETPNLN